MCAVKHARVQRWSVDAAEVFTLQAEFGQIADKVECAMNRDGVPIPQWTPRPGSRPATRPYVRDPGDD